MSFINSVAGISIGPSLFINRKQPREQCTRITCSSLPKGFTGKANNCTRIAKQREEKALQYSHRDRCNRKREFRRLSIQRINGGARTHGVDYGNFIHGLKKENILLNRKVLSAMSVYDPYNFETLVDISCSACAGNKVV